MTYIIVALAGALALGISPANATSPEESGQLQIEGVLAPNDPIDLVAAIEAMAESWSQDPRDVPALDNLETLEPAAPIEAWQEDGERGVAFPVTDDISLGLDYQLEELEELTADHIEMGSASADHASHNVMVRAQWQFDLPK